MRLLPLLLFSISCFAQPSAWQHVYDSIQITAEDTPTGNDMVINLYDTPPTNVVFPLPSGAYNIYLRTAMDKYRMQACYYLDFSANQPNEQVEQGSVINISGGTTSQALVLVKKESTPSPPVLSLVNGQTGYSMWESQGFYYAYLQPGVWSLNDFIFQPKQGEVWNLTQVTLNYDDSQLFDQQVTPNPPKAVKLEAEVFAATGGRGELDANGNPGVKIQAPVIISGDTLPSTSFIGFINGGDYVQYNEIDLSGLTRLRFNYSFGLTVTDERFMDVRIDSKDGPVIGIFKTNSTGNWNKWIEQEITITPVEGRHMIFLNFRVDPSIPVLTNYVMNLDWLSFQP